MNRLEFLFGKTHLAGQSVRLHRHRCHELVYYYDGNGRTVIGGTAYTFGPHTFALLAPDVPHDERHGADSELVAVGFRCELPLYAAHSAVYADDGVQTVGRLTQRMQEEFREKRDGYAELLDLLVGELTIELRRKLALTAGGTPADRRLQYVLRYMDEHFLQKMSVESLAAMSGYSYDRFRHLFKEQYGVAPLQYLFRKRLAHAQRLLTQTELPVAEVAELSGFAGDVQF